METSRGFRGYVVAVVVAVAVVISWLHWEDYKKNNKVSDKGG